MTELILINGQTMDMTKGRTVSLVYQSPLFTDIDNIVSNRTNMIEIPATSHNLEVVGNPHVYGNTTAFAYHKYKAAYFRDGIQIFSGFGTLLSVSATSIKLSFTWGNVNAFKLLLDYKLRDLRIKFLQDDLHVPWDNEAPDKDIKYYADNVYTGHYKHPFIAVPDLIRQIENNLGVTIEGKERFIDYRMPVLGNKADYTAKIHQGVVMMGNVYKTTVNSRALYYMAVDGMDKDMRGLYKGNGLFNVESFETIRITFNIGFSYSANTNEAQQIDIDAALPDGRTYRNLKYVRLYRTGNAIGKYSVIQEGQLQQEVSVDLNVKDYSLIKIKICNAPSNMSGMPSFTNASVTLVPDYNKEQELIYGSTFPIYQNLPDWTVAQLLKNLMKMEGLYAVCPDEHTVKLMSLDDIYKRKQDAVDITDRLILKNGQPAERLYTFGAYAQVNRFKYAEDKTVSINADGILEIDNQNLEKEKDAVKLDFAPCDESAIVSIDLYVSENGRYKYQEVKPRILRVDRTAQTRNPYLTFRGLDWPTLLREKYKRFASCISHPDVIKASMIISAEDLATLDMTRPVYSYLLGNYYAIIKLTTKDGIADVELLKLTEEKVKEEENYRPPVLTIVSNGSGGYVATLSNKTQKQIQEYMDNKDYRVCLIRHGYTRRGKFMEYVDAMGHLTNTKTSRHPYQKPYNGWRTARKRQGGGETPCWRIIGNELLHKGTFRNPDSQTMKAYGKCTLVFGLNEPMVLPSMRKRDKTNDGRIRHRASDGIAELSIALYHRNKKGKWKRVSNICQVRGRSDDKTQYWDFVPVNLKSI